MLTYLLQNPGYYDIVAEDVSVWHVPNNIPLQHWTIAPILRYHTETSFLTIHGGNLYHLFKVHEIKIISNWLQKTKVLIITPTLYDDVFALRPS